MVPPVVHFQSLKGLENIPLERSDVKHSDLEDIMSDELKGLFIVTKQGKGYGFFFNGWNYSFHKLFTVSRNECQQIGPVSLICPTFYKASKCRRLKNENTTGLFKSHSYDSGRVHFKN